MILKNQTKALHYLDRDTDLNALAKEILRQKEAEIMPLLERFQLNLQEKEAGEFYTLEDTLKVKEGELENMQRFFRGAVVPYYMRQSRDLWDDEIPAGLAEECTIEIKKQVGFLRYDHTGHITDEVNSMTTFERVKDLVEFLNTIEAVVFNDQGYIFPDSKHFKELVKLKGREAASRQAIQELRQKVKNLHQQH